MLVFFKCSFQALFLPKKPAVFHAATPIFAANFKEGMSLRRLQSFAIAVFGLFCVIFQGDLKAQHHENEPAVTHAADTAVHHATAPEKEKLDVAGVIFGHTTSMRSQTACAALTEICCPTMERASVTKGSPRPTSCKSPKRGMSFFMMRSRRISSDLAFSQ